MHQKMKSSKEEWPGKATTSFWFESEKKKNKKICRETKVIKADHHLIYSRSNVVTRGPAIWKERRHDPFEFHEHFYTDSFA